MRGERRRQIAALGAAIGIHLVAAILGGWLLLEHEEQLPPGVVEVAVLGDSGSERGAASGKTGDTVGAGSNFRDMGQNAGAAVTESAGKASPADSTSWRGGAEKALPEHPVFGEAGASGSSAAPGRTAASPSAAPRPRRRDRNHPAYRTPRGARRASGLRGRRRRLRVPRCRADSRSPARPVHAAPSRRRFC